MPKYNNCLHYAISGTGLEFTQQTNNICNSCNTAMVRFFLISAYDDDRTDLRCGQIKSAQAITAIKNSLNNLQKLGKEISISPFGPGGIGHLDPIYDTIIGVGWSPSSGIHFYRVTKADGDGAGCAGRLDAEAGLVKPCEVEDKKKVPGERTIKQGSSTGSDTYWLLGFLLVKKYG